MLKKILAAAMAAMLLLAAVTGALAEETTIRVGGTGIVSMPADCAKVTLGVSLQSDDMAAVQQQANTTMAAIYQALQDAGLTADEISTSYMYIYPQYDYSGETQKMVGYQINSAIDINTAKIDEVGAFIDAAFGAGANMFDSISFYLKDSADAQARALELAVQNAMSKAEVIASASGMKLGTMEEIVESTDGNYYDTGTTALRENAAGATDAAASTQVRASEIQVSANVQITYVLEK